MDIHQSFCVRNNNGGNDFWGNGTIQQTQEKFPWLEPLLRELRFGESATDQELRMLWEHYGLIFVDYQTDEVVRISLEIRRIDSNETILHFSFLGDPAPDPRDVIRSIPSKKLRRRSS